MENAALVVVICNIVGPFFQLRFSVTHGDGKEGLAEHGNVVQPVAEDDASSGLPPMRFSMLRMPFPLSVGSRGTYGLSRSGAEGPAGPARFVCLPAGRR